MNLQDFCNNPSFKKYEKLNKKVQINLFIFANFVVKLDKNISTTLDLYDYFLGNEIIKFIKGEENILNKYTDLKKTFQRL